MRIKTQLLTFSVCWYLATSFQSVNTSTTNMSFSPSENLGVVQDSQNLFHYHSSIHILEKSVMYKINCGQKYTSIKVSFQDSEATELLLSTDSETATFRSNAYTSDADIPPTFYIYSKPTQNIVLQSNSTAQISIELFYAPEVKTNTPDQWETRELGTKPPTVLAKEWRIGLPNPKPGRKTQNVKHCIIHHSAGDNSNQDYVNQLRNIYLLHTMSNGWDDIGYNYVVDPKGTVYEARDAQGAGDVDNIVGAHYCAKNNGTMGICLLGNYNNSEPSLSLLTSLSDLIAWKLQKEHVSSSDSFLHYGTYTNTVSSHNDGCATACPGKNFETALPILLAEVQAKMSEKTLLNTEAIVSEVRSVDEKPIVSAPFAHRIFPNPSKGAFFVKVEKVRENLSYTIKNLNGNALDKGKLPTSGLVKFNSKPGSYILELRNASSIISSDEIVIQN